MMLFIAFYCKYAILNTWLHDSTLHEYIILFIVFYSKCNKWSSVLDWARGFAITTLHKKGLFIQTALVIYSGLYDILYSNTNDNYITGSVNLCNLVESTRHAPL